MRRSSSPPARPNRLFGALLLLALLPQLARAQEAVAVRGVVLEAGTERPVPDVLIRLDGSVGGIRSGADGTFDLGPVPQGDRLLLLQHLAYGSHEHPLTVAGDAPLELVIRLSAQAILLESVAVETTSRQAREARAQGFSLQIVERDQIQAALGTSRHLGDVIRQTIPGIRLRQANNLVGTQVCLEFRGASTLSLLETRACNHPMVFLDGVPVTDPTTLYGMVGLQTLNRIQVVPPAEAGARYGTGALYGVILIETVRPGVDPGTLSPGAVLSLAPGRSTFDWSGHPTGHPTSRALLGGAAGNALGLAAGIAVARRCIGVDARDQIVSECSLMGNLGSVAAGLLLPALGSALGVRWGGGTPDSRGRLVPAALGAGLMLFPGYAFSLSTVGAGSEAANTVGAVLLAAGVPLVVTVADRLFRETR